MSEDAVVIRIKPVVTVLMTSIVVKSSKNAHNHDNLKSSRLLTIEATEKVMLQPMFKIIAGGTD